MPSITVGVPSAGHPKIDFINSLMQLVTSGNVSAMLIVPRLPVNQARSRITSSVQTSHLLFVDDDMTFPPEALELLIAANKDIVSGLYVRRSQDQAKVQPCVFDYNGKRFTFTEPPAELAEVGGVALAFTLIKKTVIDKIGTAFRFDGTMGEDLEWIKRAKNAGFETWIEPRAVIGHINETTLMPGGVQ